MPGLGFWLADAALTAISLIPLSLDKDTYGDGKPGAGGDSTGGNVPHIALWDDDGNRIAQYSPKKKEKIDAGVPWSENIENNLIDGNYADPYYIMLSNLHNDAICISSIAISNRKIGINWFGDTGYMCGQSWFLSKERMGANYETPRCAWLDADHTNGINARAMSFHINDMAGIEAKTDQYAKDPRTLCESTPRFSFWGNLLPDGQIPFFKPRLEYLNATEAGGEGADKDPELVIDKPGQYNKGIYMYQGETLKRSSREGKKRGKSHGFNANPEHLIVTHNPMHDVRDVCEHPNSFGWDIASTAQNLYCDMETKQLYKLCDGDLKNDCFDLKKKAIVLKGGITTRDENGVSKPVKAYTTEEDWGA